MKTKQPGDSIRDLFHPLVGGHLTLERVTELSQKGHKEFPGKHHLGIFFVFFPTTLVCHGWSTIPPNVPPRNKAVIRAYYGLVSVNKTLFNPYFWGVRLGGGVRLTSHECANLRLPILFRRFSQRNLQVMHLNYLWDQWRNRSSRNLLLESWIFLMIFFSDPTMANHHFPPPFGRRCLFMLLVQPPFSTHTISKESKVQSLSCHLLAAVTRVIRYLYPKVAPPRGHLHQLPLHHLPQVLVPPLPRAEGSPKCTPHDPFVAERWRAGPKPKPKPSPCPPVALPMQSIRAPAGRIPRVSRDGIALKWTV